VPKPPPHLPKALLLLAAVILAYQPAWHAGFIWDDDKYVTANPLLTAPDGLWRIWFSFDSPSQYFPLVYTTFRAGHALWGLDPAGYHWVNILLHAVNALLLWRLLDRLDIPGAWLAAAIFALHPVQVESVAWITELKNVQMGFFFLLSLMAWTAWMRRETARPWLFYLLSLLAYALALCSKTTACTLPVALLLMAWLRGKRIGWRQAVEVVPFVALGICMGLLTIWWERFHQGTQGRLFTMSFPDRLFVAAHAVWFYLGKLFWPANLLFSYPRWPLPAAWGWLVALAILCAAALVARRFRGWSISIALAFFIATLGPILGFFMLYTFRYTFVADHYQYLACIGPIALVSAGFETWRRQTIARHALWPPLLRAMLLATLWVLTWRQAAIYHDPETLWRATIAGNPGSVLAHNDLAEFYLNQGRVGEALAESREALRIDPNLPEAHGNIGNALLRQNHPAEAITEFREALRLDPSLAKGYYDLGLAMYATGNPADAITQFANTIRIDPSFTTAYYDLAVVQFQQGQSAEAVANLETALDLDPGNTLAQGKLAWILAAAPQLSVRNGPRAVQLATQAAQATGNTNPAILRTLAAAYAQDGQYSDAIRTAQRALELSQNIPALASALRRELQLYEAGKPYDEDH